MLFATIAPFHGDHGSSFMSTSPLFSFDNTYAERMEGFYVAANAMQFPDPQLLALNEGLALELGLNIDSLRKQAALVFSGQTLPEGSNPIAQAYAGHQFGGFSPQLGDGRAMMIGEIIDTRGNHRDIQLKGSGPTHFSRGGDGMASVGPVLREYLMGEALYALGLPTTRMLAAVSTGSEVYREKTYPGAVVTRVASSHIRVGTFEFFAARREMERVRKLADYVIERHYPDLMQSSDKYLGLLDAVGRAQAHLIARWMVVGFIHGVMNTDNFTVSGETIDFGPCAFMDRFALSTVFSSIDRGGRYAYGNQPTIGQWNLTRFAEALLPLLGDEQEVAIKEAEAILLRFPDIYQGELEKGMRQKLGLLDTSDPAPDLLNKLTALLEAQALDYTTTMRGLSSLLRGDDGAFRASLTDAEAFDAWAVDWLAQIDKQPEGRAGAADRMDQVNPRYIPRNHLVEEALSAAIENQDLTLFNRLLEVVSHPFDEHEGCDAYTQPAPESFTACYKTFCGT
jgi:uncharacterized protein YdiU (UPF0061 family)